MRVSRVTTINRGDPWRRLRLQWQQFLSGVLARDENGPRFRTQAVVGFFILVWGAAALIERPAPAPELMASLLQGQADLIALFLRPLLTAGYALIQLEVLRHLVLPGIIVALGVNAGARYLDDLFELKDLGAARDYLLLSLFGGPYPVMVIKDGEVTPESRRSTLYRIGGPGYVKIHLGNAALFERVTGASDLYAATAAQFLEGFERLREVVDLRDQIRQRSDMEVYTKDGLRVKAMDIQVLFRIWSNRQPRDQSNPYPYDPVAVRRVIYGKAVGSARQPVLWSEAIAELASSAVTNYIGGRLLRDLIAQKGKIGIPTANQAAAQSAITTGQVISSTPVPPGELPENTRRRLSLTIYSEATAQDFETAGVELVWIDVGTLDTPDEVEQELIDAWQADLIARVKSGRYNLADDTRKAQAQVLEKFAVEVADWWRRTLPGLAGLPVRLGEGGAEALLGRRGGQRETSEDVLKLLTFFRLKLEDLVDELKDRAAVSDDVRALLRHLSDLTLIILGNGPVEAESAPAAAAPAPPEPEAKAPPAPPSVPYVNADAVTEGEVFWWGGVQGLVRVTEVVREGGRGLWVERQNGRDFPGAGGQPRSARRFFTIQEFQRLLDAGDLRRAA